MTFTEWLLTQDQRDDMVGDLAHDVWHDTEWDKDWSLDDITAYYLSYGVSEEVRTALAKAWGEYGYFTTTWDMRWRRNDNTGTS